MCNRSYGCTKICASRSDPKVSKIVQVIFLKVCRVIGKGKQFRADVRLLCQARVN